MARPTIHDIWNILEGREKERLFHSRLVHYPDPAGNRYSNILAYDRTAIHAEGDLYLNANVVTDGRQWWVASQAPTPSTFPAFFQAIYDQTASRHPLLQPARPALGKKKATLVQLTGWEEKGQPKADRYLIPGPHGELDVTVGQPFRREDLLSEVRQVMLGDMEVTHYHFEAWPDFGVPSGKGVEALRKLVLEVDRVREGEVWVHCSAGVGRTGTFIALSSLLIDHSHLPEIPLQPSPLGPLEARLQGDKVARTVDGIREFRGMLVQQPAQLELVYDMVEEA